MPPNIRNYPVLPRRFLAAAGVPPLVALQPRRATLPNGVVTSPAFTAAALVTVALVLALAAPSMVNRPLRGAAAAELLRRAWRRAWTDASCFETASTEQRHRARKRLKRLRYAFEFLTPLYGGRPTRRFQTALGRALDALGEFNDPQVATQHFRTRTAPCAWFAQGWLTAQQPLALKRSFKALAALQSASKPWRGRAATRGSEPGPPLQAFCERLASR